MGGNEDLSVNRLGDHLEGKTIALCVSGGIAAIETPKIARQLRRYGAQVKTYVTKAALLFIGKAALEWATGLEVVDTLSGQAEHICQEDLVLVAPATMNTINKVFAGIADNPVTTLIASALGKHVPVSIAPTMHLSLYDNPVLQDNLRRSKALGISIINPLIEEGKAKIPEPDRIVAEVIRSLSKHPILGKKILITGGPTPAKIDDVRMLTTKFTGSLAVKMAQEAFYLGADVTLLLGKTGITVPGYLQTQYHEDYEAYQEHVFAALEQGQDIAVFSAAVADYLPTEHVTGKIPSGGALQQIVLKPSRKIIREVREKFPDLFMVTFKYEDGVSTEELLEKANKSLQTGYQLVIANRAEDMKETHQAHIVGPQGVLSNPRSKEEIAQSLFKTIGDTI